MAKKAKQPKLTKKEKKALYREQLALEKKLEQEGKIPRRRRYQPRSIFWRVFAVCLSFVFGIFTTLGGLVGGVLFMGLKGKTSDVLSMLGFDADTYLEETYSRMSILDFYRTLVSDLNNQPITSLSVLTKYTPLIDTYLKTVDDMLAPFGISPDWDEIKRTEFKDLGSYMQTTLLPSVEIGPILNLNGDDLTLENINSNAALYALAYGKYGTDYELQEGKISMLGDSHPTNVGDVLPTLKDGGGFSGAMTGVMDFVKKLELGSVLGLDIVLDGENENGSADMLYALCYGTEGKDYEIVDKIVKPLPSSEKEPLTFGVILDSPNDFVASVEAGTLLGLGSGFTKDKYDDNSLLYSVCYGVEGVDYTVTYKDGVGSVQMLGESKPTTVGDFMKASDELVLRMQVDAILNITAESDAIVRYIAFGREAAKDDATEEYLKDGEGNYQTEPDPKNEGLLQYVGGGRYIIEDGEIVMLPDPNTGKPYPKKTIRDLTAADADIMGGVKIRDMTDIEGNADKLLWQIRDWTIEDLKDMSKLETLKLGSILDLDGASGILGALKNKTIGDLKDAKTIESLKLGDILGTENASSIIKAMQDWTIGDLKNQNRIERLKIGQILSLGDSASLIMQAMSGWRISDLADQNRINSLTLADVIQIGDASPKLLRVLANKRIGELGDSMDGFRLLDFMEEEDLEKSPILRNLKLSTLSSLADDVQNLTVEDIFGNEMFSFMEIKDGKTFLDVIKAFDPTVENSLRPVAFTDFEEGETAQTYYLHDGTEVQFGWFVQTGESYTLVNESDLYKDGDSYYTLVRKDAELTYQWYLVNYDATGTEDDTLLKEISGITRNSGEKPDGSFLDENGDGYLISVDGHSYPVLEDGYGLYYTVGDGDDLVRYDLERCRQTGDEPVYEEMGETGVTYYTLERQTVTQGSYNPAAATITTVYTEGVSEHYRYIPKGKDASEAVQLDRYLTGAWMYLFGKVTVETHETNHVTMRITGYEENTNATILSISENITDVTVRLMNEALWELYLFEILDENPYIDLAGSYTLYPGEPRQKTVNNVNLCSMNDTIELVKQILDRLKGITGM